MFSCVLRGTLCCSPVVDSLIDSPLKGCSARLVSLSSIIEGDGRMLNCLRGPNILVHYWVILPPSPYSSLKLIYAATHDDSIWQRIPVIHHSLAECIASDKALALRFLHSHWVASSPNFLAGLEEFLLINFVYVIHDLICLHHICPFTSVLK